MNRSQFGSWGVALDDDDFARAVAALGVAGAHLVRERLVPPSGSIATEARAAFQPAIAGVRDHDPVPFSLDFVLNPVSRTLPADQLRDLWNEIPKDFRSPRLEIVGGAARVEALELVRLLSSAAVGAASVYLRQDLPEIPVVWNWPLRVGLLPGFRIAEATRLTEIPWGDLIEVAELRGGRECDLLLIPSSLPSALSAILATRERVRADCTLILGATGAGPERTWPLIESLRAWCDTAGVAIAGATRRQRGDWFTNLVRELSHDFPLDLAIRRASSAVGEPAVPLLVASRRLIDASTITAHLQTMARDLEASPMAAPPPPAPPAVATQLPEPETAAGTAPPTAEDFESAARGGGFRAESGDATDVVRMKRRMPPSRRVPHRMAKNGGRKRDDRRVIAKTFLLGDPPAQVGSLAPKSAYSAEVWIGLDAEGGAAAPETFPTHLLPPDPNGHRLTIVFAPLPQDAESTLHQPQTATLFLPPQGASDRCTFSFATGPSARFAARIMVLFENRVLQTLRYGQEGAAAEISLDDEASVYALDDLDGRQRFDAALVFNENAAGPGVFTVVDGTATFSAPVGLEKTIAKISELLGHLTARAALPKKLGDPDLAQLLFELANHGHVMWSSLGLRDRAQELAKAKRIHVVATKPGEFVPVEFLYPRDAPEKPAICKHALGEITDGKASRCTSSDPSEEICPLEFWGLNRVIERSPFRQPGTPAEPHPVRIDLFRQAIIGASDNVLKKSLTSITKSVRKLTGDRCVRAKNWKDWKKKVGETSPSLLILIPHSLPSTVVADMPALEIGGEELPASWVKDACLRKEGSAETPAVLLLGCSTQLSEAAYQNFAEAFKQLRASVVLSTLSLILGRHATAFADALLRELGARAGTGATFGDVLLDVKRKRVGKGDPFVISLVSYGDSELRV